MKILISVDTNDYNELDDNPKLNFPLESSLFEEWSLFGLSLATFQDWRVAGQTGYWTVEGETFCGTQYECEVNYGDELLLRCLVAKIKKTCGYRLMSISIDGLKVEFIDGDLMETRPEWLEKIEKNR